MANRNALGACLDAMNGTWVNRPIMFSGSVKQGCFVGSGPGAEPGLVADAGMLAAAEENRCPWAIAVEVFAWRPHPQRNVNAINRDRSGGMNAG